MLRAGPDYGTADYGVRVLIAYENKRVGQVIFPLSALERDSLVRRGLVVRVTAPLPETHKSNGGLLNNMRRKPPINSGI